jgi:hypothetical protein
LPPVLLCDKLKRTHFLRFIILLAQPRSKDRSVNTVSD